MKDKRTNKTYTYQEILLKLSRYCVYRDRCHQEVQQKFYEYNLSPEERDEALLYLMQHDFLNEERYVKSYCRGKFNQNQWGRIKIKIHLKQKDIHDGLIQMGLIEIDEEDYTNTLQQLIDKKWNASSGKHFQKTQTVYQYMIRKGYESDLISEYLKSEYSK